MLFETKNFNHTGYPLANFLIFTMSLNFCYIQRFGRFELVFFFLEGATHKNALSYYILGHFQSTFFTFLSTSPAQNVFSPGGNLRILVGNGPFLGQKMKKNHEIFFQIFYFLLDFINKHKKIENFIFLLFDFFYPRPT